MTASLMLAALLMGLAGSLHCTAMCGAACTAVATRCGRASPRSAWLGFHAGRLFGYTAGGALAAASVGAVAGWMQSAPALRPLWVLAHLAALSFGLWLAFAGRQPAWLAGLGAAPRLATAGAGWQPLRGPLVATATGGAWIALPCGLLQSALLVAVLAGDALGGAAVMATFALASSLGLLLASMTFRHALLAPGALRWAVRLSGLLLASASAWALDHGLWQRVAAYCFG
jgi:uncharacterized protein